MKNKKEMPKINRIREILFEKQMSQVEFAKRWGRRPRQVHNIVHNFNQPRVKDFPQIAAILGVKMNELINE